MATSTTTNATATTTETATESFIFGSSFFEPEDRIYLDADKKFATVKSVRDGNLVVIKDDQKTETVFSTAKKYQHAADIVSAKYIYPSPDMDYILPDGVSGEDVAKKEKIFTLSGITADNAAEVFERDIKNVYEGNSVVIDREIKNPYSENTFVLAFLPKKDQYIVIDKTGLSHYQLDIEKYKACQLIGKWELSAELKQKLVDEMVSLLTQYGHHASPKGCGAVVDEWAKNKLPMIKMFQNHPNWDGEKLQIVFDYDYSLQKDESLIKHFFNVWNETYCFSRKLLVPQAIEGYTYNGLKRNLLFIDNFISISSQAEMGGVEMTAENDKMFSINDLLLKGKTGAEWSAERERLRRIKESFTSVDTSESEARKNKFGSFCNWAEEITNDLLTAEQAEYVNSHFSADIRAKEGMRTSRMVNKYLSSNFPEIKEIMGQKEVAHADENGHVVHETKTYNVYEKEYADYSDAINPIKVRRHTVISLNPIDYLTMSFGNSWSSCHTIDKGNLRQVKSQNGTNTYHGMCCGGCLSYMLDDCSAVVYTVDNKYEGEYLELEPKINRNMIHFHNGIMVQGRMYPQSCDYGAKDLYEQFRNIEEKVIADCIGTPNLWKYKGGKGECRNVISGTKGMNYEDYFTFDRVGVCYLKNNEMYVEPSDDFYIGHPGIDTVAGVEYSDKEELSLSHWKSPVPQHECACCGERHSETEMHLIDGDWYCEDCCHQDDDGNWTN